MKLREIILDFTSLLDVFMLILFFFILFSHFEVEEAKNTADQALEEAAAISESAEQAMLDAEAFSETLESMQEQVEEELEFLNDAMHGKAVDLKALMQISRGTAIQSKLIMHENGEEWTLELRQKDEQTKENLQLAVLNQITISSQELTRILQEQGYAPEDKIPFLFLYDGTEPGSETAFNMISTAFREVRITYPHFYYMEMDISNFGE